MTEVTPLLLGKDLSSYEENTESVATSGSDERTPLTSSSDNLTISYQAIGTTDHTERNGTIFSSVFTLVSTMNGGGILSVPFAFQQAGYAVASSILVFITIASAYSAFLIIRSKKYCQGKVKNMEDVARVAFGRGGEVIIQLLIIIMCYLLTVAYLILFVDQMQPLTLFAAGPTSIWTKKVTLLSIAFLVVFPLCLLKDMSALKYTSLISAVCNLFLCACVAYRSIQSELGGPVNQPSNPVVWDSSSIRGYLTCIAIIEILFACHFNVLPMHGELRQQTTSNKRIILVLSWSISFFINAVMSFFGYFQFRKFTDQVITKNYANNDIIITCGRAALCCTVLLNFPLLFLPVRLTLNKMIWGRRMRVTRLMVILSNDKMDGPNRFTHFMETLLLVITMYLLAYAIPHITIIWGFVGAVGCTSLMYIVPPVFYLRVRNPSKGDRCKTLCAICLLVIGVILLVAGLYQAVMNLMHPVHTQSYRKS